VQEYFGEPLEVMKQQVARNFGFQIELARTEIGGYCADCQSIQAMQDGGDQAPAAAD
jgi:Fur family ferric uptake transcriptional regulator